MPSYCASIPEIDSVPAFSAMEEFQPYFTVTDGCASIEVYIKVPNSCYFIATDTPTAPADGPCGNSGDLQHCIFLDKSSPCTDNTPTLRQITLNYDEDPTGHILYIYVVDLSDSSKVKAGGKSKRGLS